MSKSNDETFKYVIIPADESLPIREEIGVTSGGLLNDALQKDAKEYFSSQHNEMLKSVNEIDHASEEERKTLLQNLRNQLKDNKNISNVDDNTLIQMLKASCQATTIEILALTMPTKQNNYLGISMYISPNSSKRDTTNLPFNERATALIRACNYHGNDGKEKDEVILHGDVFIGRYYDNELEDVWIRKDFTIKDASVNTTWCKLASSSTKSNAETNANIAQFMNNNKQEKELTEDNYKYVQNDDEIEIKFILETDVSTKDIKVTFKRQSLIIKICNEILVDGITANEYIVDESTYTVQDVVVGNERKRELCVILAKKNSTWWDYAIKKKN